MVRERQRESKREMDREQERDGWMEREGYCCFQTRWTECLRKVLYGQSVPRERERDGHKKHVTLTTSHTHTHTHTHTHKHTHCLTHTVNTYSGCLACAPL